MKKTTLYDIHMELNAKMIAFGGYEMPIQYTSVTKEHLAVRNALGVFDVSHMGEFHISGPNACDLLQHICSNDISKILIGKAQYNYFPNEKGGIVDDLIVYRLKEFIYLLVVNASNITKDWDWINKYNNSFGAKLKNRSEETSLLAIQGPKAIEAMQQLTETDLASLSFYEHVTTRFAGCDNILIATTGYTGAGGIEIYLPAEKAPFIWKEIMTAGHGYGITPIGLAARDTLRLEMGYCLYGNEINDITSPISAGLGWISKTSTGSINATAIEEQKRTGTSQRLVGFKMDIKGRIPRAAYQIVDSNGDIIGNVTSGTQSPILSEGIGLGYVDMIFTKPDTQIGILIRGKICSAHIVKLPFIKL